MSGKAHSSLYKGNDFIGKYYHAIPKKSISVKLLVFNLDFIEREQLTTASGSAGSVRQNRKEY
ncbi:hypothetical protein [Bacillus cereus]|uniref:hypothetical protein n=1 Tax=Bacillus cereus TaxID=1396 RepID=UPI0009B20544|nr:hypothetical protein [Bacillus cereus]